MSPKKKKTPEEESTLEMASPNAETVESEPVVPYSPAPAPERSTVEGKITLMMYCSRKSIPSRHRPGMRAFTKLERATYDEWEAVFKDY